MNTLSGLLFLMGGKRTGRGCCSGGISSRIYTFCEQRQRVRSHRRIPASPLLGAVRSRSGRIRCSGERVCRRITTVSSENGCSPERAIRSRLRIGVVVVVPLPPPTHSTTLPSSRYEHGTETFIDAHTRAGLARDPKRYASSLDASAVSKNGA